MQMVPGDVIGNLVINTALLGAVAFFIKKYMDRTDQTISKNREESIKDNQAKHDDLKERIQSNRDFYHESYKDLKSDIEKVAELQRIANGRTHKLEVEVHALDTSVATQIALCKQRNEREVCNGHK